MNKNIFILAFIIATRFFGLFMILPVLSAYGNYLQNSNEFLLGIAMGVYAVSQMLFQTPFGFMSDKIGRKKTIFIGLVIFIIGSLICAVTDDVYIMIFGRFLQGCGAIGGAASAMISDLTDKENLSKAMALVGILIGISFMSALFISPILSVFLGFSGLFYFSAFLSLVCIFALKTLPNTIHQEQEKIRFYGISKSIMILNLINFFQKGFLSCVFMIIPIILTQNFNFDKNDFWQIYLTAAFFGIIFMGISGAFGDKNNFWKNFLFSASFLFLLAFFIFYNANSVSLISFGLIVFFIAFSIHEPIIQSLTSKLAPVLNKGTILGLFNAFGYAGSFLGASLSGYLIMKFHFSNIFLICIILSIILIMSVGFLNAKKT